MSNPKALEAIPPAPKVTGDPLDEMEERIEAYLAASQEAAPKVTEAWQVKDYADGWIDFATAEEALAEVRVMGSALIRPTLTAAQEAGKP